MTKKHQSTQSTFIYAGDTTLGSLGISRIEPQGVEYFTKRMSSSLQNLKNPFQQILPLKFPKKRIRGPGQSHILVQTEMQKYKTHIRTSELRNKQFDQKPWKQQKGKGFYHQNQYQSQGNFVYDHQNISKSLQNKVESIFSPPQKTYKKHFHNKMIEQTLKDPIIKGEQLKMFNNNVYQKSAKMSNIKRHRGQGFNKILQWKTNKSCQKQKFNSRCRVLPIQNKNYIKIQQKISYSIRNQGSMTSRMTQRPRTYKQMYNSRKKVIQQ